MATNSTTKTSSAAAETKKRDEKEIAELKAAIEALKAQNDMLAKMVMSQQNAQSNYNPATDSLTRGATIIHLVEREPGLSTHIELSNITIDMSAFGETRILDIRQCEEICGKYRKFFNKGIIAFGADGEELASRFGLKSIKDYTYVNKDFVKQLGALSTIELENLWNRLSEGHKAFVIEYFKRQIVAKNPAFKNPHKIELLNRLSNGAMSGTTLDLKLEAEQAAKK